MKNKYLIEAIFAVFWLAGFTLIVIETSFLTAVGVLLLLIAVQVKHMALYHRDDGDI